MEPDGDGPKGPTRLRLDKPVVAAVHYHAVAGGLADTVAGATRFAPGRGGTAPSGWLPSTGPGAMLAP